MSLTIENTLSLNLSAAFIYWVPSLWDPPQQSLLSYYHMFLVLGRWDPDCLETAAVIARKDQVFRFSANTESPHRYLCDPMGNVYCEQLYLKYF